MALTQAFADAGYRGHNAARTKVLSVYTSGQKRGVTDQIKRQLCRRSAIEPVIGHLKTEHRMGRNYLAGRHGDAANTVLIAVGYNFSRLLAWFSRPLCLLMVLTTAATKRANLNLASDLNQALLTATWIAARKLRAVLLKLGKEIFPSGVVPCGDDD